MTERLQLSKIMPNLDDPSNLTTPPCATQTAGITTTPVMDPAAGLGDLPRNLSILNIDVDLHLEDGHPVYGEFCSGMTLYIRDDAGHLLDDMRVSGIRRPGDVALLLESLQERTSGIQTDTEAGGVILPETLGGFLAACRELNVNYDSSFGLSPLSIEKHYAEAVHSPPQREAVMCGFKLVSGQPGEEFAPIAGQALPEGPKWIDVDMVLQESAEQTDSLIPQLERMFPALIQPEGVSYTGADRGGLMLDVRAFYLSPENHCDVKRDKVLCFLVGDSIITLHNGETGFLKEFSEQVKSGRQSVSGPAEAFCRLSLMTMRQNEDTVEKLDRLADSLHHHLDREGRLTNKQLTQDITTLLGSLQRLGRKLDLSAERMAFLQKGLDREDSSRLTNGCSKEALKDQVESVLIFVKDRRDKVRQCERRVEEARQRHMDLAGVKSEKVQQFGTAMQTVATVILGVIAVGQLYKAVTSPAEFNLIVSVAAVVGALSFGAARAKRWFD